MPASSNAVPQRNNTSRHCLPPATQSSRRQPKPRQPSIFPIRSLGTSTELANHFEESLEKDSLSAQSTGGTNNAVGVVRALYEALCSLDVDTIHRLLASDLEWWFHGPPIHQYLMRLLTGSRGQQKKPPFGFAPDTIASFGQLVIAEGCDKRRSIFWVHAWTVSDGGVITQVREYFNTSLTVTRFSNPEPSSEIAPTPSDALCTPIWESSQSDQVGKSVPGLVLAL